MSDVKVNSVVSTLYGTGSHGEEGFAIPGGTYPAQMNWGDLHPPGLVVLPKGSAAAGEGEINWENTLGGQFALAMERLEGLLYAMFGSRPGAYSDSAGGWKKCSWWDRIHPRCLWAPEVWEQQVMVGYETGDRYHFQSEGKEYAALGEHPPCCSIPTPTVPIRSRSGDPNIWYVSGSHNRTYFPVGSVSRTSSISPYDPEGRGWFGASNPGRNDVQDWLSDDNGYTWYEGEYVDISWTKPDGVTTPTSLSLFYRLKLPGGSWGGWSEIAMSVTGETYQARLSAQIHGTECEWYIKYFWDSPSPGGDITCYEPGGSTAPSISGAAFFVWFTHFNPYANGLPEMIESYGVDEIDIRHGTDYYQFDGSETIQSELINLARFVLSWLGSHCCEGEFETCSETAGKSPAIQHNPRYRSDNDGLCCISMPIHFRWSGSNVHPHYKTGGKGEVGGTTPDSRPLHNHPDHVPDSGEIWGLPEARMTWRGMNMLYAWDEDHFDNPFYGGGYSWAVVPGTFILMYMPNHDPLQARVYSKYPSVGLQEGDVIEAVHIREIIDAVQYLVDTGIWTTIPICTQKRTPGTFMGKECGYRYSVSNDGSGDCYFASRTACDKCCENSGDCYPNNQGLGYWEKVWGPGCAGHEYTLYPDTCTPWSEPTYETCMSQCTMGKCHMSSSKEAITDSGVFCNRWYSEYTICDAQGSSNQGCGYHSDELGCESTINWWEPDYTCSPDPYSHYACERIVQGISYYACTPGMCWKGWDEDHGGLFKKGRMDHSWPSNLVATGPPGYEFSGNCLGDMFGCGTIFPSASGDIGAWFEEVVGIYWSGLVPGWFSGCSGMFDCGYGCGGSFDATELPPGLPGYDYVDPATGDPVCHAAKDGQGCFTSYNGTSCCDSHWCSCFLSDAAVCLGTEIWVAVNLNLDGGGRPYRLFTGRNGELEEWTGRCVPELTDYDMELDPDYWMHECPCESWTGESVCSSE